LKMRKEIETQYGKIVAVMSDISDGDMMDESNVSTFLLHHGAPNKPRYALEQVHLGRVVIGEGGVNRVFESADGVVSRDGILEVKTADCFPLVLVDQKREVYGAIHAGWRSVHDGIVENAIELFASMGSDVESVKAMIFPGIQQCCFEVQDDFKEYFIDQQYYSLQNDKTYFDLRSLIITQLESMGVEVVQADETRRCTHCSGTYFSHRKDKTSMRMKTFVWRED
jgi:polyphenol oxidase